MSPSAPLCALHLSSPPSRGGTETRTGPAAPLRIHSRGGLWFWAFLSPCHPPPGSPWSWSSDSEQTPSPKPWKQEENGAGEGGGGLPGKRGWHGGRPGPSREGPASEGTGPALPSPAGSPKDLKLQPGRGHSLSSGCQSGGLLGIGCDAREGIFGLPFFF